jgi:hypothetical protein
MTLNEREGSGEGCRLLRRMLGHLLRENFFDDLGEAELGAFFTPWYVGLLVEKVHGGSLPAWPGPGEDVEQVARRWFPRLWEAAVAFCVEKLLAEDLAAGKLAKICEIGPGGKVVETFYRALKKE